MKTRYYIGDPIIPWWVQRLVDCGLIIEVRENAAITFFLTYRNSLTDSEEHYLYDGDFLELNEDTGSVTIGYEDWDRALKEDFQHINWDKFCDTLDRTSQDKHKKQAYEEFIETNNYCYY